MRIYYEKDKLLIKNPVVTIGIFDGVHLGHQNIISKMTEKAKVVEGETALLTFWPHPRVVLGKDASLLRFLLTPSEKQMLLGKFGIENEIIIPFTKKFASQSAENFVETILVEKLSVKHLVVGYNHHFGKNREGTYEKLSELGIRHGFTVEKIGPALAGEIKISSTRIRELISSGKLSEANRLLGYTYFLTGKVVEGSKLGRQIGFPTANVLPSDEFKLVPFDGVYAVMVEIENTIHKAMLNIGFRPTVQKNSVNHTIEVHIFNYGEDIYGKEIIIHFCDRLRDERKFSNIEELKSQLQKDKMHSLQVLERQYSIEIIRKK